MKLLPLARYVALACSLLIPLAHAELADRNKPLTVEADSMQYDDANKTTTFTGRVVANKGTIQLRAGQVIIQQDASGNYRTTATNDGKNQAFMRQKREGLNEYIEGQANHLVRDDKTQIMQLSGNARMRRLIGTRVADEVFGDTIIYNEATEVYDVRGGASTQGPSHRGAPPAGRVRAVIGPNTDSKSNNKPAAPVKGLRSSSNFGG